MFGMPQINFINGGDNGSKGPQVRGFGFLHDGSVDTIFRFHNATVFSFSSDTQRRQVEQFMLAFDSNLAPIVGQQVTLTSTNGATVGPRIDLMIARAAAGECDLVVKGNVGGLQRGWYRKASSVFQGDLFETPIFDATLRAMASVAGQELTYTCVPPGSGIRIGVDRDGDGYFDSYEIEHGTDPDDPASFPGAPTTTTTSTTSTTIVPVVLIPTQSLTLRDRTTPPDPSKRKVIFKSSTKTSAAPNHVETPALGGSGDPTLHGAELRVYNADGATSDDVLVLLPTGWSIVGTPTSFRGYRYRSSVATDAVRAITVANDKITVKGGGPAWGYTLDEPAQGAVAVQLRLGSGIDWCARAAAKQSGQPPSSSANDRVDRFVGQPKSPPPASCPSP
jgi:hypothetical protein